jgi:hypothetical protein
MPPDLSHPTVFLYARERSLELGTSTAQDSTTQYRAKINHIAMNNQHVRTAGVSSLKKQTGTHRMFKSIAVSSAKR